MTRREKESMTILLKAIADYSELIEQADVTPGEYLEIRSRIIKGFHALTDAEYLALMGDYDAIVKGRKGACV